MSAEQCALVLVTSSECHFCSESLPFYRNIVSRAKRKGVRIIALTREKLEVNKAYLMANGVSVDVVLSGAGTGVPDDRTPSLVFIGARGLARFWVGKLSPRAEAEVAKSIELSKRL